MKEMLSGKKTYFLGALGIVWAIFGWSQGYVDATTAQGIIWASLTSMALRAGVTKVSN